MRRKAAARTAVVLAAFVLLIIVMDTLFPADLQPQGVAQSVVDSDDEPLRNFADNNGVWRYHICQAQVSPRYVTALLTYEDRWFYDHPGVNPLAMVRALAQWVRHGKIISGGSTLTMQVARLRYPYAHGLSGKWLQILRALQLDWHYSKKAILEYYLNHAPFGGTIEGVEAASRYYFGHDAKRMTWAQAALLAGLPQAPSYLRPDRHPRRARTQRNKVLRRLVEYGVLSPAEEKAAEQEKIETVVSTLPLYAPLLARRLSERYGKMPIVRTFISGQLQREIQALLRARKSNLPNGASAAVLVMEHGTGRVIAYAGSADFLDDQRFGHVDMVTAFRSPGSTLKPFIYAMAMDEGLIHSESLLMDVPLAFGDYRPVNFNRGFSGPVSVSQALVRSLNIPAVQVLEQVGPEVFYARMQSAGAGLHLPLGGRPNLAMALGGVSTSLEHLATLYSALANGGETIKPRYTDNDPLVKRPLLKPSSAWVIRTILESARHAGRHGSALAVKTGTSSAYRDTWAVGVGRYHTIGVWVGHPDNVNMAGYMGASTAVPLLEAVARMLPKGQQPAAPMPDDVTVQTVCWPTGQPGSSLCDMEKKAWIIDGRTPATLMGTREQSPAMAKPFTTFIEAVDSGLSVTLGCVEKTRKVTVPVWPDPLQGWIPKKWRNVYRIPKLDPRCDPDTRSVDSGPVRIVGISDGSRFRAHAATGEAPEIKVSAVGGQPDWYWFLNGTMLASHEPFVTLALKKPGDYELLVTDQAGQSDRVRFAVEAETR